MQWKTSSNNASEPESRPLPQRARGVNARTLHNVCARDVRVMPVKAKTELGRARRTGEWLRESPRHRARVSASRLERKRASLEKRVERLRPVAKASSGYKSVRALLGAKYLQASLAGRVAVLEAADFLVRILELLPPP
jgi:hypothetical protein